MYEIQVRMTYDSRPKMFRSVRPAGGEPYQFETKSKAYEVLEELYPDIMVGSKNKRVVKVG